MTESHDWAVAARAAAAALRDRTAHATLPAPRAAIILGSGLGGLASEMQDVVRINYRGVPGFPDVHVQGHAGEVVLGTLANVPVIAFAGRFHMYEGHSAAVAGFPVRVAHAYGAKTLVVSNAAGAVNTAFAPGDLMVITDHLNLMGASPLAGPLVDGDIRFPDMSMPYDEEYRARLHAIATAQGIPLRTGIYAALLGPAYETRAEIRMLRTLGADAVAMSLVPEVITARALGMRVLGISCITNMACGVTDAPLDHADVITVTARVATRFQSLIKEFVKGL
jgi:purine-nucleoside phosphorylase